MRVLSFDPGHTTGWAVFDKGPDNKSHELVNRGVIKDWHGIAELIETYGPDIITYEIFRLYSWKANQKSWDTFLEVEVIGVIRYLAEVYRLPIIGQTPADGKHFYNDVKLKKMELYQSITHINDATGHALFFLTFNTKKITLKDGKYEKITS